MEKSHQIGHISAKQLRSGFPQMPRRIRRRGRRDSSSVHKSDLNLADSKERKEGNWKRAFGSTIRTSQSV